MLSRHFYELYEVAFALHDSLRRGLDCSKESVFWARELLLSEEEDLLHLTVLQAWACWLGAPAVGWLETWLSVGPDVGGCKRMTLVAEFAVLRSAGIGRVSPLQASVMVARGFADAADAGRVTAALESNDCFTLYRYLGPEYAKSPSSLIEALSGFVETPELFDGFRNAIKTLRGEIQLKHLLGAFAAQTLCLAEWPAELVLTQQTAVATWLAEWESQLDRRGGRIYPIGAHCLPRNHKRGSLVYESAADLMREGCHFWQSMLELDFTLPDGLPSSWSLEDQNISHSPMAAVNGKRTIIKPADRILAVWGFYPALRKAWTVPLKKLLDGVGLPDA